MTRLAATSEKEKELKRLMRQHKVFEKDIKENFVHSSGPGGQNVNKVATCVVLHHIPTDIRVKCQEARTQAANRHLARILLVKKIDEQRHAQKVHQIQKREKERRQKRKRPGFLKEEILQQKHLQSEKKKKRGKLRSHQVNLDE